MSFISNYRLYLSGYFNLLLGLMPISFIAGNMLININLLLLVLSTIFFFKKELLKIEYFFLDKVIISFFTLVIVTGVINDYHFYLEKLEWKGYFTGIIKSFFFLKYLLLYITVKFLIQKNILKLKIFFISCSIASLFVCFDIFYQYNFGQDIFGLKTIGAGRKLGGPFGDELIAGSFIQRFSLFTFFILPFYFYKQSKTISKYVIPFLFLIFLFGIILSGNRMPMLLFIFNVFLVLIFIKQTRKYFFSFILISSIIFSITYKLNSEIEANFNNLYFQITKMISFKQTDHLNDAKTPQYLKEFKSFYDTWLMNKYIGGGIKNFRYYCHHRPNIDKKSNFVCNMHPHNYYLEILTETGIFGFFIIIVMISTIFISFIKKYFLAPQKDINIEIIPFIFLFFIEIFPIKSTGSFFTTGNTTYLFLIIGILIGLLSKKNSIEK
jgi:O-antigen ligase